VKKFSIFGVTLILAVALMALPAAAGSNCSSKASANAEAKSCSGTAKTTTADATKSGEVKAEMVNATDKSTASSCAKTCGVEAAMACGAAKETKTAEKSEEANAQMANAGACPATGKCQNITLAIKGMTCTGCEAMITKALMSEEGIYKVCSIDYKAGTAEVCIDPTKMESAKLASFVTGTGYEATVTNAAAVHEAGSSEAKQCGAKTAEISTDKKADY